MATIDFVRAHGTSKQDAVKRTHKLVERLALERPEMVKAITWLEAGAHATGRGFKGAFDVTDQELVIAIDLKLYALPFKKRVKTRLAQWLSEEFGSG